jgi:hypothetical protein
MTTKDMIAELDAEINRLQHARTLLASNSSAPRRRGRPASTIPSKRLGKRTLSPEARAKIAAAQRKRWAQAKKS